MPASFVRTAALVLGWAGTLLACASPANPRPAKPAGPTARTTRSGMGSALPLPPPTPTAGSHEIRPEDAGDEDLRALDPQWTSPPPLPTGHSAAYLEDDVVQGMVRELAPAEGRGSLPPPLTPASLGASLPLGFLDDDGAPATGAEAAIEAALRIGPMPVGSGLLYGAEVAPYEVLLLSNGANNAGLVVVDANGRVTDKRRFGRRAALYTRARMPGGRTDLFVFVNDTVPVMGVYADRLFLMTLDARGKLTTVFTMLMRLQFASREACLGNALEFPASGGLAIRTVLAPSDDCEVEFRSYTMATREPPPGRPHWAEGDVRYFTLHDTAYLFDHMERP